MYLFHEIVDSRIRLPHLKHTPWHLNGLCQSLGKACMGKAGNALVRAGSDCTRQWLLPAHALWAKGLDCHDPAFACHCPAIFVLHPGDGLAV